jgi:uncharacterized protein YciI
MFVVTLSYTVPLERIEEVVVEHRAWLDRCFAEGTLLASGPQLPRVGGVLLAPAGDRGALLELLAGDPFQQAALATYEVVEFTPTKSVPELAFLRE